MHLQAHPFPIAVAGRPDGELARIINGVQRPLGTIRGDGLAKIALLIQQADADYRDAKITGGLELVAGHVAQPA
jgi:hypothetical protein